VTNPGRLATGQDPQQAVAPVLQGVGQAVPGRGGRRPVGVDQDDPEPRLGQRDREIGRGRSSSRRVPDPLTAGLSRSRFPPRLLTDMTLRRFGNSACTANPEDLPLHHWHSTVRADDLLHRHHIPFRTHEGGCFSQELSFHAEFPHFFLELAQSGPFRHGQRWFLTHVVAPIAIHTSYPTYPRADQARARPEQSAGSSPARSLLLLPDIPGRTSAVS
jgi:hypothetical protein